MTSKYISLNRLSDFLDKLKDVFSLKTHGHTLSEIEDLIIDNEVTASANLVKNSAVNYAIESVRLDLGRDIEDAISYTDAKIADLVDSAPETLDTLGELATAFRDNKEVVDVLNDAIATKANKDYVESLYQKLTSNTVLGFYCIEDVTIVTNGISKTYSANSNIEVTFAEGDIFEIIPTSDNSILQLNAFPNALGVYYPWLEGVKQFSNILFDMNTEDMYSKWSQGNQGSYQVQYAQYTNCIFWSDNPYISDVSKRTNYTLYYTSQLPLCYSTIPDNTFKAFYLAFNVNSDPNWGNKVYRDSFAKATWATQVFSYYGARTIGIFGHDDSDFNIVLPKDCRGLMYAATAIENAGTFDAVNTTNFGAKSGSWREAFGGCSSLRNLYIKNLKVNLNISWSPINYDSIYFIISKAANTNAITITVSPYTYNLLGSSDFELAASKNITIELLTANYVEDKRLSEIAEKVDKNYVDEAILDNYIKYRTHWVEQVFIEALPETQLNGGTSIDLYDIDIFSKLIPDATCTVTLDGVEYQATAIHNVYNAYEWYTIGNGELIGEEGGDTTLPFGLFIDVHHENWGESTANVSTIKIDIVGEQVHKIPDIYLPTKIGIEGTGSYAEIFNNLIDNTASGDYSHSENFKTTASGYASHAEGLNTTAQGYGAHAEGVGTFAKGAYSHASGYYTEANGAQSYTIGEATIANGKNQHVSGTYNIADASNLIIVGNGNSSSNRSNAYTLNSSGTAWFAGDVYVGSTSNTNKDEGSKKLATEEYVNTTISNLEIEEITLEEIQGLFN